MIKFKVTQAALDKLESSVKQSLAKITEDVGLQTYNTIALGAGTTWPYWSGSYISSWNISIGEPDRSFNLSDQPNTFSPAFPKLDLGFGDVQFGQKVYITNAVPHAYLVEYDGTPTHFGGWHTATNAINQVVLSYKVL